MSSDDSRNSSFTHGDDTNSSLASSATFLYWKDYDFGQLIEDIGCTVYSEYAEALDIYDALCDAAEAEDIDVFDKKRLRGKLLVRYQRPQHSIERTVIRFKES